MAPSTGHNARLTDLYHDLTNGVVGVTRGRVQRTYVQYLNKRRRRQDTNMTLAQHTNT